MMKYLANWPWWAKISLKLLLSSLPGSYEKHRQRLTGSHGNMENPEFARHVFEKFFALYQKYDGNGKEALLELGPGGSLATGLLAHLAGFKRSILIDVGDFAIKRTDYYKKLLAPRNFEPLESFHQLADRLSIIYKTHGLHDLALLPSDSVDFVFSNSVLEHVRAHQFHETCEHLYRIQKKGAVGCHHVDFKDHLGGGLNHRRFSSSYWEKEWVARAGFYTNRIDFEKMLKIFEEVGFGVTIHHQSQWDQLPIKREQMAREFRQIAVESLRTKGALFVLRK